MTKDEKAVVAFATVVIGLVAYKRLKPYIAYMRGYMVGRELCKVYGPIAVTEAINSVTAQMMLGEAQIKTIKQLRTATEAEIILLNSTRY